MPTVTITGITQAQPLTAPLASVDVSFRVAGLPPDIVEVYASHDVTAERSGPPETVEIKPNQSDYTATLQLQAGSFYYISVCPRTITNDVKDDMIEGQYWEAFCAWQAFTTMAPAVPPVALHAWPTIISLSPESATVGKSGAIDISWSCSQSYDKWHVMWQALGDADWSEIELSSQPSQGFACRVSPVHDGLTYRFKVQGCVSHVWGPDDCSAFGPPSDILMHSTHSLRAWLQGAVLRPGVRSLGASQYGDGFRRMMSVYG
jgi:hypothetical protein